MHGGQGGEARALLAALPKQARQGHPGDPPGKGQPQMGVSQGAGCPAMLRRRDAPEATDTGWHCPEGWAQRQGHGLRGAPGQRWDRTGGVPVRNWGAGCRERGDTGDLGR